MHITSDVTKVLFLTRDVTKDLLLTSDKYWLLWGSTPRPVTQNFTHSLRSLVQFRVTCKKYNSFANFPGRVQYYIAPTDAEARLI